MVGGGWLLLLCLIVGRVVLVGMVVGVGYFLIIANRPVVAFSMVIISRSCRHIGRLGWIGT